MPETRTPALWAGGDATVEQVAYSIVESMAGFRGEPRLERSEKAASRVVAALAVALGASGDLTHLGDRLRAALAYGPEGPP